MNPDSLRALAEQRTYTGVGIPEEPGEDRSQVARADLHAHAYAWEADNAALRERLVKQLKHMRAWSRQDMTGLTMAQVTDAFAQMCDDATALAGKE